MLSARVQQGSCLVELAWLEHDSRLARLVESLTHQIHEDYHYGSEFSEVDRKDHDCYWNTIENTVTQLTEVLNQRIYFILTIFV